MPSCSKAVHPSGIEITFEESSHKYWSEVNGKIINYTSATSLVSKFFPEFDPDSSIARRCAEREGVTPEQIKAKWAAKGKESCRLGTRTHELCEDILLNRELRNTPESDSEARRFKNATEIATKFRNGLDILGVEKLVFNPYLPNPIAGTIDLFARSRKTGDYLVLDWKTNQTIEKENKWNKFGLDPISHIPDNSFYHYALQTSLYQFLLKFGKYVPANATFNRALIHLTEEKYEIIKLPDLTKEIQDMLFWNACNFKIG